eukprot:m.24156 g.24156  ORF g.24156 m.24156 type:complete len:319 (-) comp14486_c0_seq1:52-1008(-)
MSGVLAKSLQRMSSRALPPRWFHTTSVTTGTFPHEHNLSHQPKRRWLSESRVNEHKTQQIDDDSAMFGFKEVPKHQKQEMVGTVFHNVAESYDKMNDAMSLGIHRLWKRELMKQLNPDRSTRLLDVAGGTGDIAFRFLKSAAANNTSSMASDTTPHVTVCDINSSMLAVGQERSVGLGISQDQIKFVEGSAEELPFDDNSFDAYTISFGIRNVTNIDKALKEAHRVLVPGGRFICLEFSRVPNDMLRQVYDAYSFQVIPVMGELVAKDMESYQYLVESIRMFPEQNKFCSMIKDAGFSHVDYTNFTGGIVAMHSAFKL